MVIGLGGCLGRELGCRSSLGHLGHLGQGSNLVSEKGGWEKMSSDKGALIQEVNHSVE